MSREYFERYRNSREVLYDKLMDHGQLGLDPIDVAHRLLARMSIAEIEDFIAEIEGENDV